MFAATNHFRRLCSVKTSPLATPKVAKTPSETHVVVGVSGGVDSSVSAYLVKQQGYKTTALYMQNWQEESTGTCTSKADYEDAKSVCDRLGIPIRRVNFVNEYWNNVFLKMINGLSDGLTPNPDILCNREIKFNLMFQYAIEELEADYLATGHYAQIGQNMQGKATLLRSVDLRKDQTYFLGAIKPDVLEKVMFPVGHLIKPEVRRIAESIQLDTARKKDSTGICFIGKRDFSDFISEFIDKRPGGTFKHIEPMLTPTGRIEDITSISHDGAHLFTIGQRAGIAGLSKGSFVCRKDITNNIVYICQGSNHPSLFADHLIATNVSWIAGSAPPEMSGKSLSVSFKIRHNFLEDFKGSLSWFDESNGTVKLDFEWPVRAITPGQYVVFYEGNVCLGSAVIMQSGPSYFDRKMNPELIEGVHYNHKASFESKNWY